MQMKNILKKAHELTREIKVKYPEIDYQTQLGLFISYLYKKQKQEKAKPRVSRNYGTFSRRQIGVIYSAVKRNKLEVEGKFISELYNYYTDLSRFEAEENYNRNSIICDKIELTIESIFANDYVEAQKAIDFAQRF